MGIPYRPKQKSVYPPLLEELEEECNALSQANQNGDIVVDALCEKIRDQRGEINDLKSEIRRLRAEVGARDRLIEKISLKKEKGAEK